jgi:hypothetical protein
MRNNQWGVPMTISIVFNQTLFLWIMWGYIVISGMVNIVNTFIKGEYKEVYCITGVVELTIAILVMIL